MPTIPPDEDDVLCARRLAAQRCLYGVDKNPMAVDLAKLALWPATLARDHAFTFVDHFRVGHGSCEGVCGPLADVLHDDLERRLHRVVRVDGPLPVTPMEWKA